MKICIIYPRFLGPFGGEKHALRLASEAAKAGHEVTLATHSFHPACRPLLDARVKLFEGGYLRTPSHDFNAIVDFFLMPLLCLRLPAGFDVIDAVQWQSAPASVFAGGKARAFVYTCVEPARAFYDLEGETRAQMSPPLAIAFALLAPVVRRLDEFFVRRFGAVVSNGDWTQKRVKRIYGIGSQVIYPGVDRPAGMTKLAARKKLGLPAGAAIFLSVSKLHRRKRIGEAIALYSRRRERHKMMLVIGDGPERAGLETMAASVPGVRFLGVVPERLLPLYYRAADCFIFTAVNEPFGMAPLEAKVAGCKILPPGFKRPAISWKRHFSKAVRVYRSALVRA